MIVRLTCAAGKPNAGTNEVYGRLAEGVVKLALPGLLGKLEGIWDHPQPSRAGVVARPILQARDDLHRL